MRAGKALVIVAVVGAGLSASMPVRPALAQMMLPGAVAPTPQGATQAPRAVTRPKPKAAASPAAGAEGPVHRGTAVTVPGAGTLAGKVVALNGGTSQMTFAPVQKSIQVTHLTLTGFKISSTLEACRIEVPGAPLPVTPLGRLNGLERFQLVFPACPIAFDVLDGAILVDRSQPVCEFQEADCRVGVAGLWGVAATDLGPDRVKSLERQRGFAEAAVRSNYKALTHSTKDRPTIMGFAHEQAQFSSSREEICRDYADEGRHGYCAAKLTEARAARLHDDLVAALDAKAARKAARRAGHPEQ